MTQDVGSLHHHKEFTSLNRSPRIFDSTPLTVILSISSPAKLAGGVQRTCPSSCGPFLPQLALSQDVATLML